MNFKKGDRIKLTSQTGTTSYGEFIEFFYEGNGEQYKRIAYIDELEQWYFEAWVSNCMKIEKA